MTNTMNEIQALSRKRGRVFTTIEFIFVIFSEDKLL